MRRLSGNRPKRLLLLKISFATARRSGWHLAAFGVVLLLAIALLAAQAVAGNVAAGEILRRSMTDLPYDFEGELLASSPRDVAASLSSISAVTDVTYGFWVSLGATARAGGRQVNLQVAGVDDTFQNRSSSLGWKGDFSLSLGMTVLTARAASELGAGVGSTIDLGLERCSPTNGSCSFEGRAFEVSGIVRDAKAGAALSFSFEAFLTESDGMSLFNLMYGETSSTAPAQSHPIHTFLIWVNREALLNPLDASGNIQRVVQKRIQLEAAAGIVGFRSPLEDLLHVYASRLASLQGFFLAISAPSLILAAALGFNALDRATQEAYGSVRLMRVRGMEIRTALTVLMVPSAIVAVATALGAGILIPPALEALLLRIGPFQTLVATYHSWSFDAVPVVSLLAGAGLFLSVFGMEVRSVAARLSEPSTKWRNRRDPSESDPMRRDLLMVFLALGLWGYAASYEVFVQVTPAANLVLSGLVIALLPLAGVFMVVGMTRPILHVRRLRVAVGRMCAVFAGPLGKRYIVDRLSRSIPSSGVTLLVAVAVSLILLTLTSFASEQAFEDHRETALLGGDLKIEAYGSQNLSGNQRVSESLARIAGVSAVTEVDLLPPIASPAGQIVLANASSYQLVVGRDPYFFGFLNGDIATVLRGPVVIMNSAASDETGLVVGDEVPVRYGSHVESLRIVGVVPALPGLQPPWAEDFRTPLLYGDIRSFHEMFPEIAGTESPARFLLKLEPEASREALADTILGSVPQVSAVLYAGNVSPVKVGTIAQPFLAAEASLSLVLVLAASASLMSTLFAGKRGEIALLRARGAGRGSVARLTSSEVAPSLAFGFVIGILAGLASSWFFIGSLSELIDPTPLPRPFVLDPNLLPSLGLLALALTAILASVSWICSSPVLAIQIRERVG